MTIANIRVRALVQGFTDQLPINSSGHPILVPAITDGPGQGLTVDAVPHLGLFLSRGAGVP